MPRFSEAFFIFKLSNRKNSFSKINTYIYLRQNDYQLMRIFYILFFLSTGFLFSQETGLTILDWT